MAALRIVFVIALMFLGEVLSLTQECPQDWVHNGSSCYYRDSGRKTWAQADSYCRGIDSLMVVIESAEEHAFITSGTYSSYLWLGCKEERESNWVCMTDGDNTKPIDLVIWGSSYPQYNTSLSCAVADPTGNGEWSDTTCMATYNTLCERRAVATSMAANKNTCPKFCHSHKYCTKN